MFINMEMIKELINAAEHGSIEAMYELGMIYYSGEGVPENVKLAVKWLKKAAAHGDMVSEELYRQLNEDRHNEHLVKLLGEDYISKYGKAVVLHCPVCGETRITPLNIKSNVSLGQVCLAAYSCIDFADSERLRCGLYKIGKKLRIRMNFPFYCKIGDKFSVSFGNQKISNTKFITCQLLGINIIVKSWAEVSVKVLSEGTCLSFVEPIEDCKKTELYNSQRYCYSPSWAVGWGVHKRNIEGTRVNEHLFLCCEVFGGGDEVYEDYIFTDDDGIDHFVQSNYRESHEKVSLFGDKVLGYHKYCPIDIK